MIGIGLSLWNFALQAASSPFGPELVTNGDASNGTTGWAGSGDGTLTVDGGAFRYTATAAGPSFIDFRQSFAIVSGRTYLVQMDIVENSSGKEIRLVDTTSAIIAESTVGAFQAEYIASDTEFDMRIGLVGGVSGETFKVDNISVREIL